MLCDRCKKNIASTYYKQNINGKIYEYHLCDECAKNLTHSNFFFNDLLGSLIGSENNFSQTSYFTKNSNLNRCSKCGLTLNDIIKNGKVGCDNCYVKFRDNLMPSIKKLHMNTKHIGSVPTSATPTNFFKISNLQTQLELAIKNQEFELAAKLRDKINELKKEGDSNE